MWAPTLTTDRLFLRAPTADDAGPIFDAYAADERVTRDLTWSPRQSVAEVASFLADRPPGDVHSWVIVERSSQSVVGMMSGRRDRAMVELGYVLALSHWGRGLMTEAVAAVVDSLVVDPLVFRVWAYHDIDNPASGRVLEKAGLRYEGRLRRWAVHPNVSDEPRDVETYAWVRD